MKIADERDTLLMLSDAELSSRCDIAFTKGSGPGGQKRNKTSSAVKVTLPDLGVSAEDCSERSQFRNRANALRKLRLAIAARIRLRPAVAPENPDCSVSSPGYPLFAARLLDVFTDSGCDHHETARRCGISASKLVKKFYRDPWLWQIVQQLRTEAGREKFAAPK
ncbi:MAG: peptide chain release factor-like protein [Lentisphaeria bacterium]|nr:peptide chain release factor-like protein [Lentisphaeria bacterium]